MVYFGGFFAKLEYFAGFFLYIICRKDQRSCDGRGKGRGTYSNMMSCPAHSRIFSKTGISMGFSLITFSPGRNSEAAIAGGGGEIIVFRLQHSSIRI